ncbi:MAG TPA: hypothetical protein VK524_13160, partial [Polyangiaceae bacterium]|nr:hypothetical protein [Polyangiaceae bacterium]
MRATEPKLLLCAAALVAWLYALACQETGDRPPPSSGCSSPDAGCGPFPPGGGGTPRDGGARDARSDSGSNPLAELTGTVVALSADFTTKLPFPGTATIHAQARRGGFVSTSYDGQNPFRLPGVVVSDRTWVGVKPSSTTGPVLPTLQPIDTRTDDPVELGALQ